MRSFEGNGSSPDAENPPKWMEPQKATLALEGRIAESLKGTKAKIFAIIKNHPGSTITAVAAEASCSHNNVARHLQSLCDLGLVVRDKQGRDVHHYSRYEHGPMQRLLSHLRDPQKARVVNHLVQHPTKQWNVNSLAREVDVHHAFLLRLLYRMSKQGLVEMIRPGSRYYVRTKSKLVELLRDDPGAAPQPATDLAVAFREKPSNPEPPADPEIIQGPLAVNPASRTTLPIGPQKP